MIALALIREETADVTGLRAALARRGHTAITAVPQQISVRLDGGVGLRVDGEPVEPDVALGWVSLHERERGAWLLAACELAGIPVVNGAAILGAGQNKFIASARMAALGIPHIPTWLVGRRADLEPALAALGLPVVVKPLVGAKGYGVRRLDTRDAVEDAVAPAFAAGDPVYLQAHIDKPGRDIRVRVIDGVADFAFYRYAAEGAFLTNLSAGGRWEPCPLDPPLVALAESCARSFDAPIAGVDVLEDKHGALRVIELNVTPAITWPHEGTVELVCDLLERRARPTPTPRHDHNHHPQP
jgi:RimK family alpha-L-glutamate ligase